MLAAAIDGNKITDPEKYVERIISSSKSLPALRSDEPPGFSVPPQKRKGIILGNGDRRCSDRRHGTPESIQSPSAANKKERRYQNNRAPHSKWNAKTHEIMIIAVERDPAAPRKWKVGEEMVVGPMAASEKLKAKSSPSQQKRAIPLANSEENDYIVSLSRSLGKKI